MKAQGKRHHSDSGKVTEAQGPPPGYDKSSSPPVEEEITNRKRFEHLVETRKTLEENLHKVTGALELLADIIRKEEGLINAEAETKTK